MTPGVFTTYVLAQEVAPTAEVLAHPKDLGGQVDSEQIPPPSAPDLRRQIDGASVEHRRRCQRVKNAAQRRLLSAGLSIKQFPERNGEA